MQVFCDFDISCTDLKQDKQCPKKWWKERHQKKCQQRAKSEDCEAGRSSPEAAWLEFIKSSKELRIVRSWFLCSDVRECFTKRKKLQKLIHWGRGTSEPFPFISLVGGAEWERCERLAQLGASVVGPGFSELCSDKHLGPWYHFVSCWNEAVEMRSKCKAECRSCCSLAEQALLFQGSGALDLGAHLESSRVQTSLSPSLERVSSTPLALRFIFCGSARRTRQHVAIGGLVPRPHKRFKVRRPWTDQAEDLLTRQSRCNHLVRHSISFQMRCQEDLCTVHLPTWRPFHAPSEKGDWNPMGANSQSTKLSNLLILPCPLLGRAVLHFLPKKAIQRRVQVCVFTLCSSQRQKLRAKRKGLYYCGTGKIRSPKFAPPAVGSRVVRLTWSTSQTPAMVRELRVGGS